MHSVECWQRRLTGHAMQYWSWPRLAHCMRAVSSRAAHQPKMFMRAMEMTQTVRGPSALRKNSFLRGERWKGGQGCWDRCHQHSQAEPWLPLVKGATPELGAGHVPSSLYRESKALFAPRPAAVRVLLSLVPAGQVLEGEQQEDEGHAHANCIGASRGQGARIVALTVALTRAQQRISWHSLNCAACCHPGRCAHTRATGSQRCCQRCPSGPLAACRSGAASGRGCT